MHKSRESINKQQAAQMGYDPMLATAALSGCEIVKCQYYKDGKCNDPNEYVNKQGESVCGRREDAILYEDYLEMINDNPHLSGKPTSSFSRRRNISKSVLRLSEESAMALITLLAIRMGVSVRNNPKTGEIETINHRLRK